MKESAIAASEVTDQHEVIASTRQRYRVAYTGENGESHSWSYCNSQREAVSACQKASAFTGGRHTYFLFSKAGWCTVRLRRSVEQYAADLIDGVETIPDVELTKEEESLFGIA